MYGLHMPIVILHHGDSDIKESACGAGDLRSTPGSELFPGDGNGYKFQYSFLGNSMDRGAWWATVHGVVRIKHA